MKVYILGLVFIFGCYSITVSHDDMVYVKGGVYNHKNDSYGLTIDTLITIPDFYIDRTEVTIREFENFIKATGYVTSAEKDGGSIILGGAKAQGVNWRHDENGNLRQTNSYYKYPVVHVSWDDAVAYSIWAKKSLPTEAEWEYAFREGVNANYRYSGSNNLRLVAWNSENPSVQGINPVGLKEPNGIGIFDMSGNVAEYTLDYYDRSGENRHKSIKVAKGGSFVDNPNVLQYNARIPAGQPIFFHGFRCIRIIE